MKSKFKIILSFLIPVIICLVAFGCKNIGFSSDSILNVCDSKEQYIALFNYFKEVLSGTESLFYSFNKGLGGPMFGAFAYYLASPLNLIVVFFSHANIPDAMLLITVLKIGLCGLFMYIYLKNKFSSKWYILLFSIIYALMAYNVNYYFNIMWLDGVYLLPLILLGIDKIVKGKSSLLYGISLFLAILSNYYIGYMLCIFSCLYLIYELVLNFKLKDKKEILSILIRFGIASLLAGLVTSFILLPTVFELQNSNKAFGNLLKNDFQPDFNFINVLAKTFIGAHNYGNSVNSYTFHIYTTIFVLPLVYFYFVNKNIKIKEKIATSIFLGIFILSFIFPLFNIVWHGFNFPASFEGRYTFLFSFLLILIAIKSFIKIKHVDKKHYMVFLVFYLIVGYITYLFNYDYLDIIKIYVSLSLLILYLLILYSYVKEKIPFKIKELKFILIMLVIAELLFNFYFSIKDYPLMSKKEYKDYFDVYQKEINNYKDDNYRLEKNQGFTKLDSMLLNYNGINNFLSGNNMGVNNFFNNNGFLGKSSFIYYNNGNTPLIESVLGIKNILLLNENNNVYNKIDSFRFSYVTGKFYNLFKANVNVYENQYALSLGYMVDDRVYNFNKEFIEQKNYNHFIYQNLLLNTMVDKNVKYFEPVELEKKDVYNYTIKPTNKKPIYSDILFDARNSPSDTINIYVDGEFKQFLASSYYGIFNIPNKGKKIELKLEPSGPFTLGYDPFIYSFNEKEFKQSINELKKNQFKVITKEKNCLKGSINVEDKNTLFLTIPYDDGLTIKVDGKKVTYNKVFDTFIGLDLEKGNHIVEIKYYPPLLNIGIIISLISLLLFLIYIRYEKKITKNTMKLYNRYEEIINYLIVGGLTTIVSIVSYILFASLLNINYIISNVISWIFAVIFAYIANKVFVFNSKTKHTKELAKEIYNFVKYRILSLIIDVALMIMLVDLFKIDDIISKIIVQFVIVVLNYIFSKLFIFNRRD